MIQLLPLGCAGGEVVSPDNSCESLSRHSSRAAPSFCRQDLNRATASSAGCPQTTWLALASAIAASGTRLTVAVLLSRCLRSATPGLRETAPGLELWRSD